METNNVSLTISKEIVTPIVQAKIQEAILAAMGGKDVLIEKVVHNIFTQKVNEKGSISGYSSENKYTWIDVVITNQIQEAVKDQMKLVLAECGDKIKKEIMKQLSSKKGIEQFAASLLDQTTKISDRYYSSVKVEFINKS